MVGSAPSTPPPEPPTTSSQVGNALEAYNAFNESLGDVAQGKQEADSRDSEIDTATDAANQPTTSGGSDDD